MNRLARRIYPHGAVRKVLFGPLHGHRFVVAQGMGVSYGLGRGFDGGQGHFFCQHIKRGMTVYDIGANRGQMALLFAKLVGDTGSVIAFEPVPQIYSTLQKNIRLNTLNNVTCQPIAVCDRSGTTRITFNHRQSTQGKMLTVEQSYQIDGGVELVVPAATLDSIDLRRPDVLKIDVEGAAARVLKGARHLLDDYHPCIYLELHGPEEQEGVRDELQSRGYRLRCIDGQEVVDPVANWHSPLWCVHESSYNHERGSVTSSL